MISYRRSGVFLLMPLGYRSNYQNYSVSWNEDASWWKRWTAKKNSPGIIAKASTVRHVRSVARNSAETDSTRPIANTFIHHPVNIGVQDAPRCHHHSWTQ